VIWPWERERRASRAELAALGASVEDDRLDPDRILARARAEYAPLARRRSGEEADALRARFGRAGVATLLRLRPRILFGNSNSVPLAEPAQVTLEVGRPRIRIIDFRVTPDDARAEAAVEVLARARSWIGHRGYWFAKLPALGFYGGGEYPATRTLRLRSVWLYELDGAGTDWRFARFESPGSASYRYRRPLDTAAEDHEDIRDDLVLAEAAGNGMGLKVPLEIAETLPRDADAALGELAGLDASFQAYVLEAAVREILDAWAEASESDRRLGPAASDDAAAQLLGPDGTVLRGPELLDVEPLRVRALRVPPEVTLRLEVRAYLGPCDPEDDRYEAIRRKHRFWWRLARQASDRLPWRLVDAEVDPFRP
jgi:hypothetical protein